MTKINLFEDQSVELNATLFAGLVAAIGDASLSQKICGDYIDSKIDQSCGCPNG